MEIHVENFEKTIGNFFSNAWIVVLAGSGGDLHSTKCRLVKLILISVR